jgi:hypothetical protein
MVTGKSDEGWPSASDEGRENRKMKISLLSRSKWKISMLFCCAVPCSATGVVSVVLR